MPNPLENKSIVLGVCGSVASYKSIDLASKLVQLGAHVETVMTRSALKFINPLAIHSITHRTPITDLFNSTSEIAIDHIALAEKADAVVIVPATANIIAKIAYGFADSTIAATVLATAAPIIVCPAMDVGMYRNQSTQENIEKLRSKGITIAGPSSGRLASGLIGEGRLMSTEEIIGHINLILGRNGDLMGRRIVVSAGGTREPIDPIRHLTNRSTGKMGFAIAKAARDRGAEVVLISASKTLPPDTVGIRVVMVSTTAEMLEAVVNEAKKAEALIMAAAVSDWSPSSTSSQKLKKDGKTKLSIDLSRTPDILQEVSSDSLIKIGFAAESDNLEHNAKTKLKNKQLHLVVANDITADDGGFESDTNRVILFDQDGGTDNLGLLSKYEVGHKILDRVVNLVRA